MWFGCIIGSTNAIAAVKTRRSKRRPARPCLAAPERLEGRLLLSAVPPPTLPWQSLAAVDAFLAIESKLNAAQAEFLKTESSLLERTGNQLTASAADYFYKLDLQVAKIDADLIGSPTAGQPAGGIDGMLLADLALPQATQKYLENVVIPTVGQEQGMLEDTLVTTADEQISLNFTKIPVTYSSATAYSPAGA